MSKICVIIGAGDFFGFNPLFPENAFVIAADGGFTACTENGIQPDLLVGDFDSLFFFPKNMQTIRLQKDKDVTDTSAAIEAGMSRGLDTFYIYGGTGGRFDHTLANISNLVSLTKKGANGYIFGKDFFLTAIHNGGLSFPPKTSGFLSVFSYNDTAKGVNIRGLKYELSDVELTNDYPLGVSNSFTGKESRISVEQGVLLVHAPLDIFPPV